MGVGQRAKQSIMVVDRTVTELREEVRFPVVEGSLGVVGIEHAVELAVGHWTDCIQSWRPEFLQRPHGLFSIGRRPAMAGHQCRHIRARSVRGMREGRKQRVLIG